MLSIVPVASGKGGVGKTILTVNLGVTLAKRGKTVILMDLDLGSSNLHTCLGIKNRFPGIGDYILDNSRSLESLIIETDIPRLYFIPGDALVPGSANLSFFKKRKLLKETESLIADYVFMDLAAGSAYNTIDFFLSSSSGLIITTPEVTSILNAYSFLKNTLYRMLYRSFTRGSRQRDIINAFLKEKIEDNPASFRELLSSLRDADPEAYRGVENGLETFFPRVIINMGKNRTDLSIGSKLRGIARKNLSLEMEYIGYVGWEPMISQSIIERQPLAMSRPGLPFSMNLDRIAARLDEFNRFEKPRLFDADEDLQALED